MVENKISEDDMLTLNKLLSINEDGFNKLFNTINDFVLINRMDKIGLVGSVIAVNEAACRRMGYTREELCKLPINKVGNYFNESNIKKIERDLLSDKPVFFDMDLFTKWGKSIPVEVSIGVFNVDGQKVLLSVARDITDRKRIEKELKQNNKELKQALEGLKNMQEHMMQQERLAGIGQLAAGVAHEINNPLGYVSSNIETSRVYFTHYKKLIYAYKNFIERIPEIGEEKRQSSFDKIKLLEETIDLEFISRDLEELFHDVEDGLKRIKEIVNSLKSFSRVDQMSNLEDYDLNEGIKKTLLIARSKIKHYAQVIELLSEIPTIKVFGNQIDQVLLNIILNATHAIKSKKLDEPGLIIVSTRRSKGYIVCEIEDDGIGIEDENISKIFDPFFTTKPAREGTGLGLSIAYDIIVNKHGGQIFAESIIGMGTRFTIKLPIEIIRQEIN